jgi:hypothetical protein
MSYQSQAQLENDGGFQQRNRSVTLQQAETFINAADPSFKAVAESIMRDDGMWATFNRLAAGGPGIADKVDNGDGTIDQSKVTDADLLSLTQANWPTVAALFFDPEGNRLPGTGGPT